MLRKVEASGYIRAPRQLAYAVLTSYGGYKDWNPGITESRVFASEGEVSIVELIAPALAEGKLILEFVESPQSWLFYNQVDRLREDGLAGRWDLSEADDGAGVVVKGTMSSRGGVWRVGVRRRLRRALNGALAALSSRCLMLAAAGVTGEVGERRKILEVNRLDGRVELSLGGESFVLDLVGGGKAS